MKQQAEIEHTEGFPPYVAHERAIHLVLKKQCVQLAISRHLQMAIRDICFLQFRFTQRRGGRAFRVLEHPRFRAGIDLLALRTQSSEEIKPLYEWWNQFAEASAADKQKMVDTINKQRKKKSKQ